MFHLGTFFFGFLGSWDSGEVEVDTENKLPVRCINTFKIQVFDLDTQPGVGHW